MSCTGRRHKKTAIAPVNCSNVRKAPVFVDAEMSIKVPAAAYGCTIAVKYVSALYHIVIKSWMTPTPTINCYQSKQNTGGNDAPPFGPRKCASSVPINEDVKNEAANVIQQTSSLSKSTENVGPYSRQVDVVQVYVLLGRDLIAMY